jgi:mannose-6-phosphate isomerase
MDHRPLSLAPIFLEKVWGGTRLAGLFPAKGVPAGRPVGEAWELAARPDHASRVAAGPYAGATLAELVARFGPDLTGTRGRAEGDGRFPLLGKFIDAAEDLSLQVHPDDAYALAHTGDLGKMEAWYVIDAGPGARIIKGLRPGSGRDDFKRLLDAGRVAECLNAFPVKAGEVVFLPPRTLHAIGAGLVLFEIQQNSDVTYRAWDWGRTGTDGRPRTLHVDQVLEVADLAPPDRNTEPLPPPVRGRPRLLVDCRYFVLEELRAAGPGLVRAPADRFMALTAVRGEGRLDGMPVAAGNSFCLPAGSRARLEPGPDLVLLAAMVPPRVDWLAEGV